MFSRLLLAATVLTITELPAQYSQVEIDAAIDLGLRGKARQIASPCNPRFAKGRYFVTGYSPLARVARYAAGTQRRYERVPEASDETIIDLLSEDVFTVRIRPDADWHIEEASSLDPSGSVRQATEVETVVLRSSRGGPVVQPLTVDSAGSELVENLLGASVRLETLVATFASDDVIALAEGSRAVVAVVTPDGEFACRLDKKRVLRGYFPARW